MLDTIKYHEDSTQHRHREIEDLFSGNDGLEGFDQFFANLEIVIQHRVDDTKVPEAGIRKLSHLVSGVYFLIMLVPTDDR